jgi:glycosyltransferase involved in cell wall biosynthesis
MTTTLPISAIVCVKNGENTLDKCLDSIRRNNPAEIIIVDGDSTDKTLDIARRYTDRLFSDGGRGVSLAPRIGAEQAGQRYLAYIDADIVLTGSALSTMLDEFEAHGYGNLQAQVLPLDTANYWSWAIDQHVMLLRRRNPGGLSTCILRRDITLKVDFDTSISLAGDDVDFLSRLKLGGYTLGTSQVVVYHHHPDSFKRFWKERFWFGRSSPRLLIKYRFIKASLYPPVVMLYWCAYCLLRGKIRLWPLFVVNCWRNQPA